jgi:hypothetical protein
MVTGNYCPTLIFENILSPTKSASINTTSNTDYFQTTITGSGIANSFNYRVYFTANSVGTGATSLTLKYSTNGTTFYSIATGSITSSVQEYLFDLSPINAINLLSTGTIYLRIELTGGTGAGTTQIDNLVVTCSQNVNLASVSNTNTGY